MIFKAYLIQSGKTYELPHSTLTIKKHIRNTASELRISVVAKEFYPDVSSVVQVFANGIKIFQGKIFSYNKQNIITTLVAYDNLTYLCQKDTVCYKNITASQILQNICGKIGLETGSILDAKYVISSVLHENTSYMDVLSDVLEQTKQISGIEYYIYDNFGKIELRQANNKYYMLEKSNILTQNISKAFITSGYNVIKVEQRTQDGQYIYYEASDYESVKKFGKFQKIVRVDRTLSSAQCREIAQNYLSLASNVVTTQDVSIIFSEVVDILDKVSISGVIYKIQEMTISISGTQNILSMTLENYGNL